MDAEVVVVARNWSPEDLKTSAMLLRAILPMQINASINTSVNVEYKSLEEAIEEARKLGLPERTVFELIYTKRRMTTMPREPSLDRARLLAEAERAYAQAREQFFAFRRFIRPEARWNWWTQQAGLKLQKFYDDFVAGKRPRLALMAPPQHGKSWTAEDFIAWVAGRNPNLKTIYASYSEQLGIARNLNLQRMFTSARYQLVFGNTRVGMPGWACNNEVIEFAGHFGSFRNTTVNGQITGLELHLGVVDDPIKGRAEASSPITRNRTWDWFVDDFFTRFADNSALLIIMTRWHVDDLLGRLIERFSDVSVLCYPAIAEVKDARDVGEALFPEVKSLDFLLERKKMMTTAAWESEYQQHCQYACGCNDCRHLGGHGD